MQSPEVTTSVNSSAHCGFSGGIGPPYSGWAAPVGYLAAVPEILEVELYRTLAEQALGRPIARAQMVDSRYGRGGTTPQRLRAALVGRSFTAARRRGKLLLLDTEEGPTLGLRFGMTGGLVVDGNEALDRLRYGPGVFEEKWVRARITFADGGPAPDARPAPLRVARACAGRGPARAGRAHGHAAATWAPPWPSGRGAAQRRLH